MKKLIMIGVFVFAFALTMNVALASRDVTIGNENYARIDNSTVSVSNTGLNLQHGRRGSIETGTADSMSISETAANETHIKSDIPEKKGLVSISNDNDACVYNDVTSISNSGLNLAGRRGSIETGKAISTSNSITAVNKTIITVE